MDGKVKIGDTTFATQAQGSLSRDKAGNVTISVTYFTGAIAAGLRRMDFTLLDPLFFPFHVTMASGFITVQYADSASDTAKAIDRASLIFTMPGGTFYRPNGVTLGTDTNFTEILRIAGNPDEKELGYLVDLGNVFVPARAQITITGSVYVPVVTVLNDSLLVQGTFSFKKT